MTRCESACRGSAARSVIWSLLDQSRQWWVLARDGLSAFDPTATLLMRATSRRLRRSRAISAGTRPGDRALPSTKVLGRNGPKMPVLLNNQLLKVCILRIAAAQHYWFLSARSSLFCKSTEPAARRIEEKEDYNVCQPYPPCPRVETLQSKPERAISPRRPRACRHRH
jgi:hypothetical protein